MNYFIYHDPKYTSKPALTQEILTQLSPCVSDPTKAALIIVLGGDGTMIRAIRELQHLNIPFFGVNCGTLGFLLNNTTSVHDIPHDISTIEKITEPCIHARIEKKDGTIVNTEAVNDILINPRIPFNPTMTMRNPDGEIKKITGSGAVITGAVGATGYRASFRGPLIPTGQNNIGIMGIGTGNFVGTTLKNTSQEYRIDITSRDPISICIDGQQEIIEDCSSITFKPSVQTFTLLFSPPHFHSKRLSLYNTKLERMF